MAGRWCSCRLHIKLLNWSAFFTLVAEFGLDPRVVVRSVTEEGGVTPLGETVLICRHDTKFS